MWLKTNQLAENLYSYFGKRPPPSQIRVVLLKSEKHPPFVRLSPDRTRAFHFGLR
jgi:hypothetical protein